MQNFNCLHSPWHLDWTDFFHAKITWISTLNLVDMSSQIHNQFHHRVMIVLKWPSLPREEQLAEWGIRKKMLTLQKNLFLVLSLSFLQARIIFIWRYVPIGNKIRRRRWTITPRALVVIIFLTKLFGLSILYAIGKCINQPLETLKIDWC